VIFITPHIVRGDETDHSFYRGAIKGQQDYNGDGQSSQPVLRMKP